MLWLMGGIALKNYQVDLLKCKCRRIVQGHKHVVEGPENPGSPQHHAASEAAMSPVRESQVALTPLEPTTANGSS